VSFRVTSAAEMPDGYLVEFRIKEGWDAGIPRPAVLIHRFDGGHSYLIPGNSGSRDLIAGDSFGSSEPAEPAVMNLFSIFERIDVIAIDGDAKEATLRLRYRRPNPLFGPSIDPMALILSGSAYLRWVEAHHPHEPKVSEVQAALQSMTPEEQNAALSRARILGEYGKAVEKAIAGIRGE
jgi:hypothetical protein